MRNDEAKKIHKGIIDFAQQYHDLGNGTYNISSSMNVSILQFDDLQKEELEDQEEIYNLTDQGIALVFKPRKLLNKTGGNTVQFISFDSPLVPANESSDDNNVVKEFISLSLFYENGTEINIEDLPEGERPYILYKHMEDREMGGCFFYNEESEDLDNDGIVPENVTIEGIEYLKCSLEHLTSFTAQYSTSTSTSSSSGTGTSTNDDDDGDDSGNVGNYISQRNIWLIFLALICL